jgi:uncharacterized membrane protein HdeD (DUF308 family)
MAGPYEPSVLPGARRVWWVGALLGVVAIALGVVTLAWPHATIKVVGVAFGAYLLLAGLTHTGLALFASGYPMLYRLFAAVVGVVLMIVGILCLRYVLRSVVLLVIVVAIGWLLDGITEIVLAVTSPDDPVRGWRLGAGVAYVLAAVVALIWPKLTLAAFVVFGGVVLLVVGLALIAVAIGSGRALRRKLDLARSDGRVRSGDDVRPSFS